jgi:hypothetical protein
MVKKKSNAGRPEVGIDIEQLAAICRMKPSLKDCAAFFKCSEDTIQLTIKKKTGLNFTAFRDQNMVHSRFGLIRTAMQKANSGDNCMLIFCLKNLCGWADKMETTTIDPDDNVFEDRFES